MVLQAVTDWLDQTCSSGSVIVSLVCGVAVPQVGLIRIMFNIHPLENLKVYISSRPPLVVFMISVSAMAIAFLTLGYFFKIKEIKSPEMAEVKYEIVYIFAYSG